MSDHKRTVFGHAAPTARPREGVSGQAQGGAAQQQQPAPGAQPGAAPHGAPPGYAQPPGQPAPGGQVPGQAPPGYAPQAGGMPGQPAPGGQVPGQAPPGYAPQAGVMPGQLPPGHVPGQPGPGMPGQPGVAGQPGMYGPPAMPGQPGMYGPPVMYGQPAAGAPMAGGASAATYPTVKRVITPLYVVGALLLMVGGLLTMWGVNDSAVEELLAISWLPAVVGVVFIWVLLYKAWGALQDGYARTTPGLALGLLFIPFFNIYWLFVAIGGWGRAFNAFADRHQLQGFRATEGLFIAHCVITLVPIANMFTPVTFMIICVQFCRGINTVASRGLPAAHVR